MAPSCPQARGGVWDSVGVRVSLLGPLAVDRNGTPLPIGGARLRALLARLALEAGRAVPAERLVEDLWEAAPPADAAHALQSLVSRLRRALGDPGLVAGTAGGYRLTLVPEAVDALAFEGEAGPGGEPAADDARLATALERWRGPALSDLRGAFAFAARAADRLEQQRSDAILARATARLELGDPATAAALLAPLLAARPADERAAALQMRALAADGRPADALGAYEALRRALDDELGTVPAAATRALHATLLRGEAPALGPGSATSPAPPDPASSAAAEPASAPSPRAGALPEPVTALVGRDAEVERALGLLEGARLLTLVGPGGAGKTRLGIAVAARRQEALRDGAWLVELAPLVDGGAIAEAVLAAIGRRDARLPDHRVPTAHREAVERLTDALAGEQLLLVLDNCEHVVDEAARLVDALLPRLPGLQVLTTSREPLGIAGEHLLEVGPLGLPAPGATPQEALRHPAVALFAARAAQTRPGFAVDAGTVGHVVEICRRLDGLPLALELAAARLRTLPLAEVAARLDDRFRLLTGGSRAALPRQRTLRAVVDWSWELLEEDDQRLARRAAVFTAGITPADAAAVCKGDQDVHDGLAALAERSLLQLVPGNGEPRYRMLETLREYGVERMAETGELERVRTAHARHVAALASEGEAASRTPEQVTWFHRLATRREDLHAALRRFAEEGDAPRALRLANDLLWFWMFSNAGEEATDTLRVALAVPGDADFVDRLVADTVLVLSDAQRHPEVDPRPVLSAALERLRAADLSGRPLALALQPLLAFLAGRTEDELEGILEELVADPDPWVGATARLMAAQALENAGEVERSRAIHAEALAGLQQVGDHWLLAVSRASDAALALQQGELEEAEAAFDQAAAALAIFGGTAQELRIGLMRSELRLRQGDPDGARAFLEADLLTVPPAGEAAAILRGALAGIAHVEGDLERAQAEVDRALAIIRERGSVNALEGHTMALAGSVGTLIALSRGERGVAAALLREAHAAAVGTRDRPVVAHIGVAAAWLAVHDGRPEEAAGLLGAAERLRGAPDATAPQIIRLRERLVAALGAEPEAAAVAAGRAMEPDAAQERIAAASDAA